MNLFIKNILKKLITHVHEGNLAANTIRDHKFNSLDTPGVSGLSYSGCERANMSNRINRGAWKPAQTRFNKKKTSKKIQQKFNS